MAMRSSPGPRKSLGDLASGGKDTSLAEWTSEIRKIQLQVDREAELEAKRLEEEIAASRLQRMSRRKSSRKSVPPSADPLSFRRRSIPDGMPLDDVTPNERDSNQSAALRKLLGQDARTPSPTIGTETILQPSPVLELRPSPSLASLIGGKGTGPRLNKQAPQQDAHDPTHFKSSPPSTVSPSTRPLYGGTFTNTTGGGVALPGLQRPDSGGRAINSVARQALASPSRGSSDGFAERKDITRSPPLVLAKAVFETRVTSPTPALPTKPTTPTKAPTFNAYPRPSPGSPVAKPVERPSPTPATSIPSLNRVSPMIVAAALSRSEKPAPTSFKSTMDLLRAAPSKELHPSLSRLQGRGFVANRVATVISSPAQEIKANITSSGQVSPKVVRSSVLDRWQPVGNDAGAAKPTPSTSETSVVPPRSSSPRIWPPVNSVASTRPSYGMGHTAIPRPLSQEAKRNSPPAPSPVALSPPVAQVLQHRKSVRAIGLPGMPRNEQPPPVAAAREENEEETRLHTMEREPSSSLRNTRSSATLSHPTRDRAKKPRKARSAAVLPSKPYAADNAKKPEIPAVKKPRVELENVPISVATPPSPPEDPKVSPDDHATPAQPLTSPPRFTLELPPSPPSVPKAKESPPLPPNKPKVLTKKAPGVVTEPTPAPSRVAQIMQSWAKQAPIAAREIPAASSVAKTPTESASTSRLKRRALPGLAAPQTPGFHSLPSPPPSSPGGARSSNRRSVMDIARGMREADEAKNHDLSPPLATSQGNRTPSPPSNPVALKPSAPEFKLAVSQPSVNEEQHAPTDVRASIADWSRNSPPSPSQPIPRQSPNNSPQPRPRSAQLDAVREERRRSSYEKYASIMLPPLAEEKTPTPSPMGSLARREPSQPESNGQVNGGNQSVGRGSPTRLTSAFDVQQALLDHRALLGMDAPSPVDSPLVSLKGDLPPVVQPEPEELVTIVPKGSDSIDQIDVPELLKSVTAHQAPAGLNTIQVDVMTVSGNSSTAVKDQPHVFYDVEVRAIIHRAKSKASGLVTTQVYGWRGRRGEVGALEARKLGELASRFGTSLIPCIQGSETPEVVRILGGVLVTRQGAKSHWSSENTAMHCIREIHGAIYVDEIEPESKNLCSGFSYVASVLDQIYIRHGKGASDAERHHAQEYASILCGQSKKFVEFEEGEEDPMFAMALGDDDYANADYWKYRKDVSPWIPRLYRVDAVGPTKVFHVSELASESLDPSSVFVLDGDLELYVVVGAHARSERRSIRLAISLATVISERRDPHRPFRPPVHVLILPSQVPLDLKLGLVRYFDEEQLNPNGIPSHMNVLTVDQALEQLSTTSWPKQLLRDHSFLPLGLSPSDIPAS